MSRRHAIVLSGILLLALGLRLAQWSAVGAEPSAVEEIEAQQQGPLYPWFVGLVDKFSGEDSEALVLVQVLLSALACWVLFEAGRRFGDPELGLAAAGLAAIYPAFYVGAATVGKTSLDVLLAACLLWALAAGWRHRDASTWLSVGWACGLMMLLQERYLLILPPLVLMTFFHGFRVGARRSFGVFCGMLMVLVPVAAHVYRAGGDPLSIVVPDAPRSERTIAELGRFWTWEEPSAEDATEQPLPRPLRLRFGTLCILAAAGLWWLHRHFVHFLPVLVFVAGVTVATVFFSVASIDREVVVLGLMLLAALPLRGLWFAVRERRWWEVAALELLVLVAVVMPWWV